MSDKTYEMLWDCKYCGTRRLLGLTHRFCPSCGAPQDPSARYFPSDAEKVAVEDHHLVGRDVICPSCREVNARSAKHCGHCGGPLEAAADVATRADQVVGAGVAYQGESAKDARAEFAALASPTRRTPARRSRIPFVVGGLLLLAITAVLAVFFIRKDVTLEVASRQWSREIAVERFGPVRDSAWCNDMPRSAREVTRSRKKRSTKQVADGETCATRKVDNGNGTFTERQECKTKYRDEPVYADFCTFTIDRWTRVRSETAKGAEDPPRWPEPVLAKTGSCVGCERVGTRSERYRVQFAGSPDDACSVAASRFATFSVGSRWKAERRALTGGLVCDSLAAAGP